MNFQATPAPELIVSEWFNIEKPISLAEQRGRVIVMEAFQMLCPGCVSQGLPQARRVAETFASDDVLVIGLHSVFEHHDAQGTRAALQAFLREYRIDFPVAIDRPSADGAVPRTMAAYRLRGTPSLILVDRDGYNRYQHFGIVDDLALGAQIMQLVGERRAEQFTMGSMAHERHGCDASGCAVE